MEISIRHIGYSQTKASKIIEMTVTDWGGNATITENITDLKGNVDENLIMTLRTIADELEEQNKPSKNLEKDKWS